MRRIKKAKITFISLVPAGANKVDAVYKSDGTVCFGTLIKASESFDEQGELTAVVYAPNLRDSQGDIADAEVVKQMAHDFISNGANVDINHDGKALSAEQARVAETFLVQKTDTRFHGWKDRDGNAADLTGAWATVIKIEDPELRKKYRSGDWAGVSMGGTAIVEHEKAASLDRLVDLLNKAINPNPAQPPTESTDMTPQELETITKTLTTGLAAGFTELAKALKPEAPAKPETPPAPDANAAPVFRGSWTDERAVRKHVRDCEVFELRKATIAVDPSLAADYLEGVKALKAQWAEEDAALGITAPGRAAGPLHTARQTAPVVKSYGGHAVTSLEGDLLAAGEAVAKQQEAQRLAALAGK